MGSSFNVSTGIRQYALARYNANGSLDTTFGTGEKVTTNLDSGNGAQYWYAATLQPDGKILTAGGGKGSASADFAVARYNTNGTLDTSFNTSGRALANFGGDDTAVSIALQSDGKIVLAGTGASVPGAADFGVARFNANGTLDTTFDGDGKVLTDMGTNVDAAKAVVIEGDGKMLVSGYGSSTLAIARYLSNGSLDTSFGTGGKVAFFAYAEASVIQWDGKLIVAGRYYNGSNYDFALARYWLISCP